MRRGPTGYRLPRQEHAYGVGQFAVGGHIKNEFCCRGCRIVRQRGPLPDKIILIHVALRAGVSLKAAKGHADIINRRRNFVAPNAAIYPQYYIYRIRLKWRTSAKALELNQPGTSRASRLAFISNSLRRMAILSCQRYPCTLVTPNIVNAPRGPSPASKLAQRRLRVGWCCFISIPFGISTMAAFWIGACIGGMLPAKYSSAPVW